MQHFEAPAFNKVISTAEALHDSTNQQLVN
jgi:hypothetical protein